MTLFSLLLWSACANPEPAALQVEEKVAEETVADTAAAPAAQEPVIEYDEFGVERGVFTRDELRIQRRQTFSDLLSAYDVSPRQIYELARASKPVFDLRRLRAGRPLHVYQDSLEKARLVVYQPDPVRYVVFDLRDSLHVYQEQRALDVRERAIAGVITSSPYQTLVEQGADPGLAAQLAEVFAWQIDFYRIRRGDHFRLLYEERFVDNELVGVGRILAAHFHHAGDDYYGFYFEDEEGFGGYYDEEGSSLRKAFLAAPLKYSRISSRYQPRRFHPVLKRYKAHLGTDYAAPTGTPVYATGDGVVQEARYARYNGRFVKIRHNGTYTSGYLHLSRIAPGITRGKRVQQGDLIGYVGSTGLATGPHLCYRFWKNGTQVDPYKQELPPSEPVAEAHRDAFHTLRDRLMKRLETSSTLQLVHNVDDAIPPDAL